VDTDVIANAALEITDIVRKRLGDYGRVLPRHSVSRRTSMPESTLTLQQLRRDLAVRDLTDPQDGPHAIQLIVDEAVEALEPWGCEIRRVRTNPVVSVADNYDGLRISPEAVTRDTRYTRYVGDGVMLRSHTSAMIPPALRRVSERPSDDVLLVCAGIVYRRDSIDRLHSGTPHQLDLWRVRKQPPLTVSDLDEMVDRLVGTVLPGRRHCSFSREHPYTTHGRQVDVREGNEWVEIAECGLAHPEVLEKAGIGTWTGLAMGIGLDRLLMLRKGIPDIRLLRGEDERIASQMLDLERYHDVSPYPPIRRHLSMAVDNPVDGEELGDRVRLALGEDSRSIETVRLLSETPAAELPASAVKRLGLHPGQKNVLVEVVLRDLERTITDDDANQLRDRIYDFVHQGTV
jgi:phenylalanyl-tRNA synthetase alpha chain